MQHLYDIQVYHVISKVVKISRTQTVSDFFCEKCQMEILRFEEYTAVLCVVFLLNVIFFFALKSFCLPVVKLTLELPLMWFMLLLAFFLFIKKNFHLRIQFHWNVYCENNASSGGNACNVSWLLKLFKFFGIYFIGPDIVTLGKILYWKGFCWVIQGTLAVRHIDRSIILIKYIHLFHKLCGAFWFPVIDCM